MTEQPSGGYARPPDGCVSNAEAANEVVMANVLLGVRRMVPVTRCSRIVRQPVDERVAPGSVLISVRRLRITRAMSGVSTGLRTSTTRTREL